MALILILQLILIIVLLLLSGFFSASEIAIVAIRASRLRALASSGDTKAAYVEMLKKDPDRFFAVVQIGMTVTASAASAIAGAAAITIIGPLIRTIPIKAVQTASEPISVTLVVIVISYLFLVVAELVPKALAIRRTEPIALWAGPLTWYSIKALAVIITILTKSTNFCLKLLGLPPETKPEISISEREVKFLIKEGMEHGIFDRDEQRLIHSVFEFTDTTVRRAMTPRVEIVAVEINDSPEALLKTATQERFSRFPVYEKNLDNIKGIIHSKDLLQVYTHGGLFLLSDILRPAVFVPDSRQISDLLRDMQKQKFQMAVVLDEFGGTAGIITMEDVVEEIVGDIQDEYDQEATKLSFIDENKACVLASMPVDEFANEFGVDVEEGDYDTVGGMVITRLGKIPAMDETIDFEGFSLTITKKDGHRIRELIAQKIYDSKEEK